MRETEKGGCMDKDEEQGRSHLFLLRLWSEDGSAEQSEWSARLQHVFSGETHTFRACPQLVSVLLGLSGVHAARVPEEVEPDNTSCS
jgi:hypothetical protein